MNTENLPPLPSNDEELPSPTPQPVREREPIECDFDYLTKNFNGAMYHFIEDQWPIDDGVQLRSLILTSVTGWRRPERILHSDGFAAENAYDDTTNEIGGHIMSPEAMRARWITKYMEEVEITLGKYSGNSELKGYLVDLLEYVRTWAPPNHRYTFPGTDVLEHTAAPIGTVLLRTVRVIQRDVQERIQRMLDERYKTDDPSQKLRWVKGVDLFGHLMRRLVDHGYIAAPATKPRKGKIEVNAQELARALMQHFDIEYEPGKMAKASNVYQQVKDMGNNTDAATITQLQKDIAASAK